MKQPKILINGASGRIGRAVTYNLNKMADIHIKVLNDPVGIDALVRNFQRPDSTHGTLDWHVRKGDEERIYIDSQRFTVTSEKDPCRLPLDDIDITEECSGFYQKDSAAKQFVTKEGQKVIMSYPATGEGIATIIMGVNQETYDPEKHWGISNGSCTTKAIAGPLKILLDCGVEIDGLLMDTVHAATNSQHLLDYADDYAALNQIITHKTGAAKATGEVLPQLKGKMDGLAFRVPTTDGSFANMYFVTEYWGDGEDLTAEKINNMFSENIHNEQYYGRVALYTEPEAASSDIIGRTENGIIIASKTRVIPLRKTQSGIRSYLVSLVSGYDNELGPPRDQALLTKYIAEHTS